MASGDLLARFTPFMDEQPVANMAMFDARNQHPVLDFDDTTDESAVFSGLMPANYSGGGITVTLTGTWTSDTDNGHTTQMEISLERIGDAQQDIDVDSFAAAQDCTLTVNATCGLTDVASVAFTDGAQMDNVAAGELFRLKAGCDCSDSSHVGDFELLEIKVEET